MTLKTRATWISLLTILAICAIGLLPAAARAVLFSQPGTLSLSFTALANGSVSSTVAGSGAYVLAAPSGLISATWGGGCSGASTVSGFSASGGVWSATFTTPSAAGTGCMLTVTGTGSNTLSATSPGVTISSGSPATVSSVTCSPATGLLTATSGSNTATCTITFSASVTASGSNVLNLSDSIACPIGTGTGITLTASCTFTSGSDTSITNPTAIYLGTAASGAISGGTISNGGGAANLAGANGVVFFGLSVDTTSPLYFTSASGSGSACSLASPCLPAAAQTKARASMGHIYARGGTYSGLATSNVSTNSGSFPTAPVNILMTTADNNAIWFAYPDETPVWDGGCPTNAGTTPTPSCAFAPFGGGQSSGGSDTRGNGTGVSNLNVQGFTFQHYYGAGFYEWWPINLLIANNTFLNFYNTCGNPLGGDGSPCNGAGGAIAIFNAWTNVQFLHNHIENFAGFGTTFNGGVAAVGSYTMTKTIDSNYLLNGCSGVTDCGFLYLGYFQANQVAGLGSGLGTITNNFIKTTGTPNGQAVCIYADDFDSGENISRNICTGIFTYAYQIHQGSNNHHTNNIIDLQSVSPYGTGSGGNNSTAYYAPNSTNTGGTASNNSDSGDIIYNGTAAVPPIALGICYNTSGNPCGSITFGPNWYYTGTGSFNSNFAWGFPGAGGDAGVPSDPSGVLANPLFVNAPAQTAAGFLMSPGTVLTGFGGQIKTNQGPYSASNP